MKTKLDLSKIEYKISSTAEILKKPYGEIESHVQDEIRIKFLNLWNLKMKSFLKKFFIR